VATAVEEDGASRDASTFLQSHPNPFNDTTTIRFGLAVPGEISLQVVNMIGQCVATLASGEHPTGDQTLRWNGADEPATIPELSRFRMPQGQMIGGVMQGLVQCAKVFVATSSDKGAGAFAACDMGEGEVVECGIVRRLPAAFDGNSSPYVFTWSEDRTVWAVGSGCSTFYNCSETPNTKMHRDFENDTFEITALRPISKGEELTHVYKSLAWRGCFADLR